MGSGRQRLGNWLVVLWNDHTSRIVVKNTPGALNWSIGDAGNHASESMPVFAKPLGPLLPSGIVESAGKPVKPDSLYLEQLRERMGPQAVRAIGYH